jgi:thiamine-phosphate pyrophosphorylase
LRLYLITPEDAVSKPNYEDLLRGALRGGVCAVQLRMKQQPVRLMLELGRRIREATREYGALFIVNDRADVALSLEADAVHLGANDLSVAVVRRLAPSLSIGATVRNPREAVAAVAAGASYLGCGAVFPSTTKSQVPVAGLECLAAVVAAAGDTPVVGIGGIRAENVASVVATRVAGVAAIAAFSATTAGQTEARARAFAAAAAEQNPPPDLATYLP